MKNKPTLADWKSQGLDSCQGESFAQDIHSITPLALFTRAIPKWVDGHQTSVHINIECQPGMGGAAIEIGFGKETLSVKSAQEFIEILIKTARLMELESHIEMLRGAGGSPDIINKMIDEAEELAESLK